MIEVRGMSYALCVCLVYANEWEQYSTVFSVRTPVQTVIGSKERYLVINWNLTGMFLRHR